jgi:hypothetical protein
LLFAKVVLVAVTIKKLLLPKKQLIKPTEKHTGSKLANSAGLVNPVRAVIAK